MWIFDGRVPLNELMNGTLVNIFAEAVPVEPAGVFLSSFFCELGSLGDTFGW